MGGPNTFFGTIEFMKVGQGKTGKKRKETSGVGVLEKDESGCSQPNCVIQ